MIQTSHAESGPYPSFVQCGVIHLVMSTIPSHYSKPFVHQRFRKALSIVQHYSSSLEPTKDQRLEVISLSLSLSLLPNSPQWRLFIYDESIAVCAFQASFDWQCEHSTTWHIRCCWTRQMVSMASNGRSMSL